MTRIPDAPINLPIPAVADTLPPGARILRWPRNASEVRMSSLLRREVSAFIDAQGRAQGLFPTPIEGVSILRSFQARMPVKQMYKPQICVVLQGAKEITFGGETLRYGAMECLAVGMDLPATGRVVEASSDEPYTGITIELDVTMMRDVLEHLGTPPALPASPGPCLFVSQVDEPLADCIARLIRMFDRPESIPILYPSVMREICYWLLSSPYGSELCKLVSPETNAARVSRAIYLIHSEIAQTLRVEELAKAARMSASSFHQHFKALTSMTPLQYQKQLRLIEARRMMVIEDVNVAEAAYQVGYESASQFSREYSRMFGVAPKRDVMNQQRLYNEYVNRKVQPA